MISTVLGVPFALVSGIYFAFILGLSILFFVLLRHIRRRDVDLDTFDWIGEGDEPGYLSGDTSKRGPGRYFGRYLCNCFDDAVKHKWFLLFVAGPCWLIYYWAFCDVPWLAVPTFLWGTFLVWRLPNDDDRWKRRRKALKAKVVATAAGLKVVPDPVPA